MNLEWLTRFIKGVGMRLVVHTAALVAAAIFSASQPESGGGSFMGGVKVFLSTYVGVVCLVPRGMGADSRWLFPVLAGIAQVGVSLALGLPLPYALLWGGFQTWGQRLLLFKGKVGWEWAALPWLLLCLMGQNTPLAGRAALVLVGVGVTGYLTTLIYIKLRSAPIYRGMLQRCLKELHHLTAQRRYPVMLDNALKTLVVNCEAALQYRLGAAPEDAPLIMQVESITRQLSHTARLPHPEQWDEKGQRLLDSMEDVNSQLTKVMLGKAPIGNISPPLAGTMQEKRLVPYWEMAATLLQTRTRLAPREQVHVDSIHASMHNILAVLEKDASQLGAMERFMQRYGTAAVRVAEECARLHTAPEVDTEAYALAQKSRELLARLSTAFAEEYTRLTRHEAELYSAELKVLERLLSMQGH